MTDDDGAATAGAEHARRPDPVVRRPVLLRLAHEAVLLGLLWLLYTLGRAAAGRRTNGAFSNADDVWALERDLHLPSEAAVQRAALHWEDGVRAAGVYYKYEHFASLGLVVLYLLLCRPEHYRWFRRVLVTTTALALVGHAVYPLAPPRMRPDLGIVDTGLLFGHAVYGEDRGNHGLLNQYAAMPSMHVGWAVLFAVAVVAVARTPLRWAMLLYPALTTWVVVVTGNHYWLDGIVGAAALAVALVVHRAAAPWRPPRTAAGPGPVS